MGICGLGSLGWKEQLSFGASNLPLSDLTHALHCDRVCRQDAASTCARVEASAREPRAEKPEQQPERPVEAAEYPLEGDRSSLEPPGQEA